MISNLKAVILIFVLLFNLIVSLNGQNLNIAEGDKLFIQMKYSEAIRLYSKESENAEAQWKIARANICLTDVAVKANKRAFIDAAEKAARKSIQLNSTLSEGHTWLAAALGNKAIFEGSKSKVLLCHEIKKELLTAIKLNPKDDIAYSILGTFYRALGNISWVEKKLADLFIGTLPSGGYSESEEALKKAISLSPKTVRHWYELGKLYEDWDKDELVFNAYTEGAKLSAQVESDKKRIQEMKEYLNE